MTSFDPKSMPPMQLQALLQGAVAPRPICFASTVDAQGQPNLSPFSFFNIFSSNPPILVFSPARRVRDNTTKHTLENIIEVPEVCINMVNHDMVWQTSLASTEYAKGEDEFIKAGFTKENSQYIKPYRVKESPVQMECKVNQVLPLGTEGGAGNLIICEVILVHVNENILYNDTSIIDPHKIDLVSRMGGDWYCRANGNALFEIEKPVRNKGIGVDQIPKNIRESIILTGNDLGQLGNVEQLPTEEYIYNNGKISEGKTETEIHELAHQLLAERKVNEAWTVLLYSQKY